jgi:serine/threonine protein kinase
LYRITHTEIGRGKNGIVYEGYLLKPGLPPKKVAIKKVRSSPKALKEVAIMKSIPHNPNVCTLLDAWEDTCGNIFIAMELINGRTLADFLDDVDPDKPIATSQICQILLQIFAAIAHLHEHLIFHGDIKPANIMIVQKEDGTIEIKIVDFGHSTHFGHEQILQGLLGTPLYFSPEIASEQSPVDHSSDIWAMGPLILYCLTGSQKPWYLRNAKNVQDVLQRLKTLDFSETPFPRELLEHKDPIMGSLARIAQMCLSLDKSERPSAQAFVRELTQLTESSSA